MLSLYDMMMQAQNGNAVETMARQFGLAQEQATKAVAALMPAFSEGFNDCSTILPLSFLYNNFTEPSTKVV